ILRRAGRARPVPAGGKAAGKGRMARVDTERALPLSEDEFARWERDGYHVARGLFGAEEVAAIRDRFDRLAERREPIEGHWAYDPEATDVLGRYPRVMHPHELDPANQQVFLDRRVQAVLRQLMGEEVIGCQTMF